MEAPLATNTSLGMYLSTEDISSKKRRTQRRKEKGQMGEEVIEDLSTTDDGINQVLGLVSVPLGGYENFKARSKGLRQFGWLDQGEAAIPGLGTRFLGTGYWRRQIVGCRHEGRLATRVSDIGIQITASEVPLCHKLVSMLGMQEYWKSLMLLGILSLQRSRTAYPLSFRQRLRICAPDRFSIGRNTE